MLTKTSTGRTSLVINPSILHSTADIITNSSTEIFCCINNSTINKIKNLVNTLFKVAGSNLIFDDVFTIKKIPADIEYQVDMLLKHISPKDEQGNKIEPYSPKWYEIGKLVWAELESPLYNTSEAKYWTPEYVYTLDINEENILILVRPDVTNTHAEQAAKMLEDIQNFFEYTEREC